MAATLQTKFLSTFSLKKSLYFDWNFDYNLIKSLILKVHLTEVSNIGSGNDLMLIRQQAITWTNVD